LTSALSIRVCSHKAYKATATEERPVDVAEQDQALDFFHGLDQGRYAQLKTSMLNGWATKAFHPPNTPNDIYSIAGAWVKLTSRIEGGTAATFVTIEEEARINKKCMDRTKGKKRKRKRRQRPQRQLMQQGVQTKKASKNIRCRRIYCTLSALDASNQAIILHQRNARFIRTIRNKSLRQGS